MQQYPWFARLFGDEAAAEIFSPEAEIDRMLKVEAAWSRSLAKLEGSQTASNVAGKIEAMEIKSTDLEGCTVQDGIPLPGLVKMLKASFSSEESAWIHDGLTSQDVMDTTMVLALLEICTILQSRLETLDHQLNQLVSTNRGHAITAYTRMQPALPTTADVVVANWRMPFNTLAKDLTGTQKRLGRIQWGGPIGTRDRPKRDALGAAFAEELGLSDPGHAWHTDRSSFQEFAALLSRVCNATGKIGEDVVLMSAIGDSQIRLKRGGKSSAMPHKNNPTKAEALSTLARQSAIICTGIMQSGVHESFRSGRSWSLEILLLPELCVNAAASLRLAADLINQIDQIGTG